FAVAQHLLERSVGADDEAIEVEQRHGGIGGFVHPAPAHLAGAQRVLRPRAPMILRNGGRPPSSPAEIQNITTRPPSQANEKLTIRSVAGHARSQDRRRAVVYGCSRRCRRPDGRLFSKMCAFIARSQNSSSGDVSGFTDPEVGMPQIPSRRESVRK